MGKGKGVSVREPRYRDKGKMVKSDEYIKMFWVGLMDGDGSIQVNHWRKKSLQYRLIIKLSNIISNYEMLIKIAKIIGGSVRITGKGEDVIWVVNKKETVIEIIKIFDTYPLLTSRKRCQLLFLKTCLLKNSVDFYLSNRNYKYINQPIIINSNPFFESESPYPDPVNPNIPSPIPPLPPHPIPSLPSPYGVGGNGIGEGGNKGGVGEGWEYSLFRDMTGKLAYPNYFKGWLSGFIEAEGCFSIRKNNVHSFSIGQNDDFYLINAIKQFVRATNIVRNPYGKFYFIEIYNKETLKQIIDHFNYYPLLGEKAESLKKFNQTIQL
uniref:Homing endonuclease LAGLIDADG domain-containing protein n=2 Tax=Hypsizygus marmoreus TaxID=39966 RepID=A0A4D6E599_HYPMA|nr:hypothetical protein HM01MITGene05 [Hypsizygus marmoreus]QBZ73681.1 hypothetical protein HM01MITGene05 [Hypsizygus marmoreus]